MKITSAEFVISAVQPRQYPDESLPEIAFVGRSNVGKSSLINRLVMRKALARTSSQPGRTQTINFYRVNESLFLVDLPGYGYAKVAKTMRASWAKSIEQYLASREQLKLVVQVTDVRHPPTVLDQEMCSWLDYHRIPTVVVATKTDKISRGQRAKQIRIIRETLAIPGEIIIPFSAETGEGREELWQAILAHISEPTTAPS